MSASLRTITNDDGDLERDPSVSQTEDVTTDKLSPSQALSYQCQGCFKGFTSASQLMVCNRCRLAHYCDRDCQTKNWKAHKKICSPHESRTAKYAAGFSLADLQLFTSIHRGSLNEAATYAMGLYDKPEPSHPSEEWVYCVQLNYQPQMRKTHEGKMFALSSARPMRFDKLRSLYPRLNSEEMQIQQQNYVKSTGENNVVFVLLINLVNIMPFTPSSEEGPDPGTPMMPDPEARLRNEIAQGGDKPTFVPQ